MKNVLLNDRFFTREIVENMFDVKVRTKFNKLRYVLLKEYMKKNEEKEMVKEFKENKKFPLNSYPMSFNNFVEELIKDVRDEIENLKEQDKKMFQIK